MFQNNNLYTFDLYTYFKGWSENPINLILGILDVLIVLFLLYKAIRFLRKTRAWQLLKGIAILIIVTLVSGWVKLGILNMILTTIMTYGAIILIVVFAPELRRSLEQLGTNKLKNFFGISTKSIENKTKEVIYMAVIAATEMAKKKVGALIVFERDIKIQDIISTGIAINSEVSPQLLCNIFVPNTPLHDGAVVISDNKIAAAACMLPLSDDLAISKELGTRHRAAIGLSKQCDSIVVVVSEETGKISIAKDGTLIADVKEETLKKILLKNLIVEPKADSQNKKKKKEKKEKKEVIDIENNSKE